MEDTPNTMSHKLTDNLIVAIFGIVLNHRTDVTDARTILHNLNAQIQTLASTVHQTTSILGDLAYEKSSRRVTMKIVYDRRDIDVYDVAFF